MPFKSIKDAEKSNAAIVAALNRKLYLVNIWYRYYDEEKKKGNKQAAMTAWVRFKKKYMKDEKGDWVLKSKKF